jgi:hypothetical protein
MNEGAGTSAFDLSPYNNAGTVNGASWVDGKYGKALSFDGINDYVEVADSESLHLTKFSIGIWIKAGEDIGDIVTQVIARPAASGQNFVFSWGHAQDSFKQSWAFYDNLGVWHACKYLTPLVKDRWYHLVGTYDGANFNGYLDGKLDVSILLVCTPVTPAGVLQISRADLSKLWAGIVDEVRVFNRALTQAEILQLYRVGNSRQNVGEQAVLAVKLAYEYDGTPITTGAFTLNGLPLTHQGSGVWTATDSKGSVQAVTYNGVSGTEGVYGLTAVNMNGASATVIWDQIKLTACGILNNVVDTRTGGKVWYQAVYEYSVAQFSGASGKLSLNSAFMNWTTDRWTYDFPYQMTGSQAVFQVTGVSDTNYGLTTLNPAAGDVVLNWATMAVTISKP